MSLEEYIYVSTKYCQSRHAGSCKRCWPLISAAKVIQERGICPRSHVYPTAKYNTSAARRRLLQLQLAAIRCGSLESGTSLMEILPQCSHLYQKVIDFYHETLQQASVTARPCMTKDQFRQLLTLTQNHRERGWMYQVCCVQIFWTDPLGSSKIVWIWRDLEVRIWLKRLLQMHKISVKVMTC